MSETRGELAVFTLLHNYYYSNQVCRSIVHLSNERVSELEEIIKARNNESEKFRVEFENLSEKEFLYEVTRHHEYVDATQRAEIELMAQLELNLKKAQQGIRVLEKKYEGKEEIQKLSEKPDKEIKDIEKIEDKARWIHYNSVVANGGLAPDPINYMVFEDNEQKVQLFNSVAEKDVFLIAHIHDKKSLEKKVHLIWEAIDSFAPGKLMNAKKTIYDKIIEIVYPDLKNIIYKHKTTTEMFLDALCRGAPTKISLLTPYFLFSRGDQQDGKESITSTLTTRISQLLGANLLLPFTLHAPQIRAQSDPVMMKIDNLELRFNIEEYVLKNYFQENEDFVVMATDAGGGKTVQKYAADLRQRMALAYKARSYRETDTINGIQILGDISNSKVLIIDDEIDTGHSLKTLIEEASRLTSKGIYIAVSHGKFTDPAIVQYLKEAQKSGKIAKVLISDTILHSKEFLEENKSWLDVINTYDTYGQAIYHIHCGMGLSELYDRQIHKVEQIKSRK